MGLEKRKYTKAEVEKILREQKFSYETSLSEQKERIFKLLSENHSLLSEIDEYKNRNELVGKALLNAVEKAKEIDGEAKKRYASGVNSLKVFQKKFVKYFKQVKAKYPIDSNLMSVEDFLNEMDAVLGIKEMNEKNDSMLNKLNTLKNKHTMSIDEKSGFDINEALNPTGDLEDICRELGFIK